MKGRPIWLLCPNCRRSMRERHLDSIETHHWRMRAAYGIRRTGRIAKGIGRFKNLPRHEVQHRICGYRWLTTYYNRS